MPTWYVKYGRKIWRTQQFIILLFYRCDDIIYENDNNHMGQITKLGIKTLARTRKKESRLVISMYHEHLIDKTK